MIYSCFIMVLYSQWHLQQQQPLTQTNKQQFILKFSSLFYTNTFLQERPTWHSTHWQRSKYTTTDIWDCRCYLWTRPLKGNYDYSQNQSYVATTAPLRGEGVVTTGGVAIPRRTLKLAEMRVWYMKTNTIWPLYPVVTCVLNSLSMYNSH